MPLFMVCRGNKVFGAVLVGPGESDRVRKDVAVGNLARRYRGLLSIVTTGTEGSVDFESNQITTRSRFLLVDGRGSCCGVSGSGSPGPPRGPSSSLCLSSLEAPQGFCSASGSGKPQGSLLQLGLEDFPVSPGTPRSEYPRTSVVHVGQSWALGVWSHLNATR